MKGISTRNYQQILPAMAETAGVGRSSVSREFIEASEQALKKLCERRLDDKDILVVYLDGVQFGSVHVVVALGIDSCGYKHILGLRDDAGENATVVTGLLTGLVGRGLAPEQRQLFVIDGSKALKRYLRSIGWA